LSEEVRVVWVDDDTSRREDAKNLQHRRPNLKVELLSPLELESVLGDAEWKDAKPDLFLLDYYLDRSNDEQGNRFAHKGLTVAGQIRETLPEHPIYMVTAKTDAEDEPELGQETRAARATFDRLLSLNILKSEGANILYHDALDYRAIRQCKEADLGALIGLLKPPQDETERLRLVLPTGLREGLRRSESSDRLYVGDAISFAAWVRGLLLAVPGILYDELYAATHLGVNDDGFRRLIDKLEEARYEGVFSKTTPKRWWVSKLNDLVFRHGNAHGAASSDPRKIGPQVFEVGEGDLAKCGVCGERNPETVGVSLENEADSRPVHFKCSRPHPRRKKELYFDEYRAFDL